MAYEISGTSTPSKIPFKWGLLKNNMKVTARMQPQSGAKPCSFSPIQGLTRIEVCDQIADSKGTLWCYCKVGDKYGFILWTSIRDYLRTPNQSIDKVAHWVIADDFGTESVRRNALESLGYDYDAVQKRVSELMPTPKPATLNKFAVWAVNFMEDDEGQYGDCTAVLQYNEDGSVKHCVLIDCAKAGAAYVVVRKLKAHGVKRLTQSVSAMVTATITADCLPSQRQSPSNGYIYLKQSIRRLMRPLSSHRRKKRRQPISRQGADSLSEISNASACLSVRPIDCRSTIIITSLTTSRWSCASIWTALSTILPETFRTPQITS